MLNICLFLLNKWFFWSSYRLYCYTDNNTIRLEGCGNVIGNLLPILSVQVHCYPECTAKVRSRYKSTAAERRTRSHQWELLHCSGVYTVEQPSISGMQHSISKRVRDLYILFNFYLLHWKPQAFSARTEKNPGDCWVSKSMECDIFPSVLWHCLLGDRKGIRPVKSWVLVCWWWQFDWSFARLIAPVVSSCSSLAPIKSRRHSGKCPLQRRQTESHNVNRMQHFPSAHKQTEKMTTSNVVQSLCKHALVQSPDVATYIPGLYWNMGSILTGCRIWHLNDYTSDNMSTGGVS